ncbi:MAG: PEGA domain-containing protein [Brevinema sp.]
MPQKKIISFLFLLAVSCAKLPVKEEIQYRNRLENEIVKTFPKKLSIVVHPFADLTPRNTNDNYLRGAIPDVIEGMLEPMRSTLAYIPIDNLPFYVSESLSNMMQVVKPDTNETNVFRNLDPGRHRPYFSYLSNYLIEVPVQVTQIDYRLTTNTNYFRVETNVTFRTGDEYTNYRSNEILQTTTNEILTNLVEETRNVLTSTNMLLLLYEEFPELINYLSYIPIEIRRATDEDIEAYNDYLSWQKDPVAWRKKDAQRKREEKRQQEEERKKDPNYKEATPEEIAEEERKSRYPDRPFDLTYHITGSYTTAQANAYATPDVDIRLQISDMQSSGLQWWVNNNKTEPPALSKILRRIQRMDTNDINAFKKASLRIPFEKEKIAPRIQEEFDLYSGNFREDKPDAETNSGLPGGNSLRLRTKENRIATEMSSWLKVFHATFINRPYARLSVDTNPPDTLVYLDGFYIGKTPLSYPTAPLGEHRVTFIKDGYEREEVLIDVKPDKINKLNFNLAQRNNSGTLVIKSSTPTEVFLDAQFRGMTPLTISNLSLNKKYRVEVLNPRGDLSSNRNSFYKSVTLTEQKPKVDLDVEFKNYETSYKAINQKGLLIGTYVSWIATLGILGASIYTQVLSDEYRSLSQANGISTSEKNSHRAKADQYSIASQVTLYTAIAGAIVSSGIMGWYLYSKEVYLGLDYDPGKQEFFANLKLKF